MIVKAGGMDWHSGVMRRLNLYRELLTKYRGSLTKDVALGAKHDYEIFGRIAEVLYPYIGDIKGKTILDIGCGPFYPLPLLFQYSGNTAIGIDSEHIGVNDPLYCRYWRVLARSGRTQFARHVLYSLLLKNRKYYRTLGGLAGFDLDPRRADIRYMKAEKMSFHDESFDIVVSVAVFEHIVNVPQAVAEIHRVLRGGGIAYTVIDLFTGLAGGHISDWEKLPPWYHLRDRRYTPPFYLNGLRKDDYLSLFSQELKILEVREEILGDRGLLTPEVRGELSGYSEEELLTRWLVIIAQKKS